LGNLPGLCVWFGEILRQEKVDYHKHTRVTPVTQHFKLKLGGFANLRVVSVAVKAMDDLEIFRQH
jgi:hypothetical protein